MGKSRNYDKEIRLIDKLKRENKELKRENANFRRQIERLDLDHDRYRTLRELVHKQTQENRSAKKSKDSEKWKCFRCGKGVMKIHIFPRRDGNYYYRCCSLEECGNRTNLKKHTEEVEES